MSTLIRNIQALTVDKAVIIGICGLPGAGKTTLSRQLAGQFQGAEVISADDFCVLPTSVRKGYLTDALQKGDVARLNYLAQPDTPADNPYADPLSWYDWPAMANCLHTLKAGHAVKRSNAWNQQTGELDKLAYYKPLRTGSVCFVDSIYLFEPAFGDLLDYKIMIELDPKLAAQREAQRDAHRSDHLYLEYKRLVTDIYCKPYLDRHRKDMDFIVTGDVLSPSSGASPNLS